MGTPNYIPVPGAVAAVGDSLGRLGRRFRWWVTGWVLKPEYRVCRVLATRAGGAGGKVLTETATRVGR